MCDWFSAFTNTLRVASRLQIWKKYYLKNQLEKLRKKW